MKDRNETFCSDSGSVRDDCLPMFVAGVEVSAHAIATFINKEIKAFHRGNLIVVDEKIVEPIFNFFVENPNQINRIQNK